MSSTLVDRNKTDQEKMAHLCFIYLRLVSEFGSTLRGPLARAQPRVLHDHSKTKAASEALQCARKVERSYSLNFCWVLNPELHNDETNSF